MHRRFSPRHVVRFGALAAALLLGGCVAYPAFPVYAPYPGYAAYPAYGYAPYYGGGQVIVGGGGWRC